MLQVAIAVLGILLSTIVGVLLLVMGSKGLVGSGFPYSKVTVLTGRRGRWTGAVCGLTGLSLLMCDGFWVYGLYRKRCDAVESEKAARAARFRYEQRMAAERFHSKGRNRLFAGRIDESIRYFSDAIRLEPAVYLYFADRGAALTAKADYTKAVSDYDVAIRMQPEIHLLYLNRGHCHLKLKRPKQAKQDYETALRLDSNSRDVLMNLAWLCATSPKRSLRDGRRALKLVQRAQSATDERCWECHAITAAAFAELQDYAAAIKRQEQALTLAPYSEKARLLEDLATLRAGNEIRDDRGVIWQSEQELTYARLNQRIVLPAMPR